MKSNIKIQCLKDLDEISNVAFDIFSEVHQNTANRFYIVPGGTTPSLFLNLMSEKIENWSNTQIILSDERIVDDKRLSNESMVDEALMMKIDRNEKPVLLKYNRNGNQTEVETILKNQSPNIAILGLGHDGHTASLFSGNSEILNENGKNCLRVKNSWEDYDRVSLSFSYLMKSDRIIFMVSGDKKAEALKECVAGDYNPIQFPAQYIFHNFQKSIHIFCDKSAGKHIK